MADSSSYAQVYAMLLDVFPQMKEEDRQRFATIHQDSPSAAINAALEFQSLQAQPPQPKIEEEEPQQQEDSDAPQFAAKVSRVKEIFPNLGESVVGGAIEISHGDVDGAIEMLFDVQPDEEAIRKIREMNPEGKAKLAREKAAERQMKAEREALLMQQKREQQKREMEEQQRQMKEMKEREAREKAEREKDHLELANLLRAQQEQQAAQRRVEENASLLAAEVARLEQANAAEKNSLQQKIADLESRAAVEASNAKEAQAQFARLADEVNQRRMQEPNLNAYKAQDPSQSVVRLKADVLRGGEEARRAKEAEAMALAKLEAQQDQLRQQDEEIAALRRRQEQMKQCTLSASYCQQTKELSVSWSLSNDRLPTSKDWIGVFKAGTTDKKAYQTYIHTNSTQASTSIIKMPTEPGLYVCIFYYGPTEVPIANSESLYLGPSLALTPLLDTARGVISLKYKVASGNPSNKDWIGFYRSDKPDKNYISYHYLHPDKLEGTWDVPIPRRGGYKYEFRFFSHVVQKPLTISAGIELVKEDSLIVTHQIPDAHNTNAQPVDTVSWKIVSVDPSGWDWVELYDINHSTRTTWFYANQTSKAVEFAVPRTPGRYVYRYWAKSIGSGPIALSNAFEVANNDSLTMKYEDGQLIVTWNIHTVQTDSKCWIGLFSENADNSSYHKYEYIPDTNVVTFKSLPGVWQARFFSSADKRTPVVSSQVVQVLQH